MLRYLWKDLTLDQLDHQLRENVRDIIALGFNREKTFIFSNFNYMGGQFYRNIVQLQKRMTGNQAMKALGLKTLDNIGKFAFSAIQGAPSFSSSFPHMFGAKSNNHCLIPCAIDQDVYFRITRDIATKLRFHKPAVIHSSFFPGIGGHNTKMSASAGTTIFLTSTMQKVHDVIHKYAFSGAPSTLAEHREKGANLEVDISYQYLRFFLANDAELENIGEQYSSGKMLTVRRQSICACGGGRGRVCGRGNGVSYHARKDTNISFVSSDDSQGEVKDALVTVLQNVVQSHQDAKAKVTDEEIAYFMSTDPKRFGRS
jgi:tryptophanyl-tRNA synthetase